HITAPPVDLPSFPTRRSSDLASYLKPSGSRTSSIEPTWHSRMMGNSVAGARPAAARVSRNSAPSRPTFSSVTIGEGNVGRLGARSEEHTSELQSRSDLVCRLL